MWPAHGWLLRCSAPEQQAGSGEGASSLGADTVNALRLLTSWASPVLMLELRGHLPPSKIRLNGPDGIYFAIGAGARAASVLVHARVNVLNTHATWVTEHVWGVLRCSCHLHAPPCAHDIHPSTQT